MHLADGASLGRVAQERRTAVDRAPGNAGRRFIPLLLGDCAFPETRGAGSDPRGYSVREK